MNPPFKCLFCDYESNFSHRFVQRDKDLEDGVPFLLCKSCFIDPDVREICEGIK